MADKQNFNLDDRSGEGPRRNIWGAFSQQDGSKSEDGTWEQGRRAAGAAGEAWSGAITDAVGLANKIITEQIELGRKVASQLNSQVYGFGDSVGAPTDLAESMLRSFTELSTGWLRMMADMSSMFVGGPRESNGNSGASHPNDAVVESRRRTRITANLPGVAPGSRLVVNPLSSDNAELPPLTDFLTADTRPFVTVTVPDDQPAGWYFGAVFDRSRHRVVGSITVTVVDSPDPTGSA